MKKIINGRRYDTDTARLLGETSYSHPGDFAHWAEKLYQKSTGEFFLYGAGGPMSRYAEVIGQNEWTGGEKLIPLTTESAQKWAETYLSADKYEDIFGIVEEDQAKRTVSFSLTEATIKKISRMAADQGCAKSEVIERLLSE